MCDVMWLSSTYLAPEVPTKCVVALHAIAQLQEVWIEYRACLFDGNISRNYRCGRTSSNGSNS
eukprot:scaffold99272_cov71-Cyclotella_meneghiniana.AAC.3